MDVKTRTAILRYVYVERRSIMSSVFFVFGILLLAVNMAAFIMVVIMLIDGREDVSSSNIFIVYLVSWALMVLYIFADFFFPCLMKKPHPYCRRCTSQDPDEESGSIYAW